MSGGLQGTLVKKEGLSGRIVERLSTMNTNETTKRLRRLDSSPGVAATAAGVSHDDAVSMSRLEQRMNSMEASQKALQDDNERLKAKVAQLDDENRRLEAAFKTHLGNMNWKYAAPEPPSDLYWIQQGYDQDYIDCVNDEFFPRLKEQTEKFRHGTFGLAPDDDIEDLYFGNHESATLMRYDRALLPHWREFCNAMESWQLSDIRGTIERTHPFNLCIQNIEMPRNVLKMLSECLKWIRLGHVEHLHLEENEFQGSDGIEFAVEVMQSQKKMIGFRYESNPVDNGQDCQRLVDAIASHPSLSNCYLNGLCGGERNGHDYLVDLLRKEGMKEVDFAGCGVNTPGQSALFDIIKLHPNLDRLRLDNNKLNDRDAIHLADALRYNRTLVHLQLWGNEFTQVGEDALKNAIYDDSSLNAVSDSNHVCKVYGLRFTSNKGYSVNVQGWGRYDVYHNQCQVLSRARKIFHFLGNKCKEGRNCLHLETERGEDTLKAVPLALAAVQIYGEQLSQGHAGAATKEGKEKKGATELSITYELLQRWHVTVLC